MEIIGHKFNRSIFEKVFKLIRISNSPHYMTCSCITRDSRLVPVSRKPTCVLNNPNSVLSHVLSFIRPLYISNSYRGSDSNKGQNEKFNGILEKDLELQNIMKDIMSDFSDPSNSPPSNPTSTGAKKSDNGEGETNERNKLCEACGDKKDIPFSTEARFRIFDDSQTEEILDFDEEEQKGHFYLYQEKEDKVQTYNFKRGQEGVFDIEELVAVLQQENASDLVVLSVPEHLHYCKYLVIVTAKSQRHLKALSEFLPKLYKKKKSTADPFIITEGKDCKNWKVLDMGHIVLHMFLEDTRIHYDLETLWTVGEQYDDLSNVKADPVLDLLQQHIQYLDEIEPLPSAQKH